MKYLLFGLFASVLSFSQVTEEWVKRHNGTANNFDIVAKLMLDQSENIYVYGTSNETNRQTDMIVLKYNSAGNLLWNYTFNGNSNGPDWLNNAVIDFQGNSYLTGSALINDTQKTILIKISSAGSYQWLRALSSPGAQNQSGNSAAIDPANNIYNLGAAQLNTGVNIFTLSKYNSNGQHIRTLSFPGLENTGSAVIVKSDNLYNVFAGTNSYNDTASNYDAKLWKFDSTGLIQWVKYISGSANLSDAFIDMSPDNQNNIYILTAVVNTGTLIDFRTGKFSSAGTLLWQRDFNGSASNLDYPFALTTDNGNNVYVTGYARSGDTLGTEDVITIKYDAAGNIKWSKIYNGTGNGTDQGMSICVDSDRNVYVGGASGIGGFKMAFMTIKYDSLGNLIWIKTYHYSSTTPEDFIHSIAVNTKSDVYVTGISFSNTSDYDIATIKYSQPIGITPISNEVPKTFDLHQNYPNPFNPTTKIRFSTPLNPSFSQRGDERSEGGFVTIKIYDILGREIATLVNESLNPGLYEIEWYAGNYPSGVYYYRLIGGEFSITKKMVLLK